MIGKLTGRVDYRAVDHVLLDVRGVGYLVFCSERTLSSLPPVGEMAAVFTDMLVQETNLQLFGFTTLAEKEWHKLLISVQGVGAKASLAILGALGPDGVGRAIALGDWNAVKAAKGVGPKLAQRVVMDLKDKAPAMMAMGGTVAQALGDAEAEVIEAPTPRKKAVVAPNASAQSEALSALSNLGYSPGDAAGAVARAAGEMPDAETTVLIRAALKLLAPKE
ncbi:Holliday junction branch migration protein RuvA [Sulfitobacter guttiformis]|uniref:Holliday junction branch migration complex subunit RuvA n=1 Tax=Sulfitobacter guttiformis TaxID=74349 RepID=A0A420DPK3_9RHOB|nr:Holliday junction branch migration protein RuvA [Sulfitobacter guttiformis]KIN73425.1 Holliday junction ATP-dependent DNA helicase RuvA [Sulfitobacter guttiformis KCTC 32187]RKE96087.1 Holliday junction DNA helicase subunit RuvA [Sulfitobacter guttiformis]